MKMLMVRWYAGTLPGKIIENKFGKVLHICRNFRTFANENKDNHVVIQE